MTDSVVVEGYARLRDGKKWKTRWIVLRKPSPVADCLVLLVYKDKSERAQGNRERASVTLEEICGVETGQCFEGVVFTLTILCLNLCALLGFDSKEALLGWEARLRYSLGEVHRFCVAVLPGTKLETGPATLHLCNNLLALARDVPPVIIGHWNLPDLRRYGPVPNGFVFEGGTRCGYWAGVFLLASGESEQISFLFDCVVRGVSPTRGPFGLKPVLPDLNLNQTNSEEKLNHETQELEKRLSMLSHRNSTISSTYCPSAGGDDRSISGSSDTSDTSQSDCSIGSRLVIWSDSATTETSGQLSTKCPPHSTEKLCVNPGVASRPSVKAPRQLQEIGRQSSSDSGIATGSHSSYSGSFSSYTGSLDIHSTEDCSSVFTLPPHLTQDLSPCSCPAAPGHEYQVPNSVRYLYDTPRSLLQDGALSVGTNQDSEPSYLSQEGTEQSRPLDHNGPLDHSWPLDHNGPSDHSRPSAETETQGTTAEVQTEPTESLTVTEQTEQSQKNKVAPSSDSLHPDSCHICSSFTPVYKAIVTICSTCGGYKLSPCIPPSGTAPHPVPANRTMQIRGLSITNSKAKSEDSLSLKKGRDKLVSLLTDLLGYSRKVDAHKVNSYESMSPAFGLRSCKSRGAQVSGIYENCVRCEGEQCTPPPRPPPPIILLNRSASSPASLKPSAPVLRTSQEPVTVNEQGPDHSRGSQTKEVAGSTPSAEDKRPFGKDEQRRADYEVMEGRALEKNLEGEEKSKYELMSSCGHQRFFQETEGSVFVFPPEAPVLDRLRSDAVTYVNIPISPTSKKQLNYMELELQEMGPGPRGTAPHLPAQKKCSTKYAQIDITATETAHKVGTQHALGRQEGLHTLELRRKATPH